MATQNDAETASRRAELYQQTAKTGRVLNRTLAFYDGSPVRGSFTGSQILGVTTGGAGAALINGAGPPLTDTLPCDAPTILDLSIQLLASEQEITVTYQNPLPNDIFVLFNSSGQSFPPLSVVSAPPNQVLLYYPLPSALPPGSYSLRILRASNPGSCIGVRNHIFNVEGIPVCTLSLSDMSSPTGVPVFPPGPSGDPSGTFDIDLVGTGFLSGPLTIVIINTTPPFNTIPATSYVASDDNNLQFEFTGDGNSGLYIARVSLTADPTCFAEIGDIFFGPIITLALS